MEDYRTDGDRGAVIENLWALRAIVRAIETGDQAEFVWKAEAGACESS